ncbi:hypothetical protein KVT40_003603 [Elsinoe batatas]|uniref:Aminoglycoside phosphotransferase domain-containing protein n=1 Tax=Elsinoe batatas TaxID=2601811 RepID=A0A8K0L5A9_9PEZI|nr:hypothetical protein KVT40_003603 [Elsinoe batatas]
MASGSWDKLPITYHISCRDEVVRYCEEYSASQPESRTRLVNFRGLAVKFGQVTSEEAENQRLASSLIAPEYGFAPQVYDYFSTDESAFLVMEYIDERDAWVRYSPPLLGNAVARSRWRHYVGFASRARRHRQLCLDAPLSTEDSPLVLTHGDISRRNIMISRQQKLYLVDWEFAAYLPRSAEFAILRQDYGTNQDDREFRRLLHQEMLQQCPLSVKEEIEVDKWLVFAFNTTRYIWPPRDKTRKKYRRGDGQSISASAAQ